MDANVKKVLAELRSRRFAPVYFLHGEETFYIDLLSEYIENHALSEAEKGFNQVVVYGKDVTMASILTHARRFPMMSEKQVVIVKEAQEIPDLLKDTGSRLLLDYLKNPLPSTILVFCHKNKTVDKRFQIGKQIAELSVCIVTKKLYDNQLPEFVAEYTRDKNIAIDEHAMQALCEFVGNDLHRLANEIDKLAISLSPGESITPEKVMNQVGVSREYNIFELQKAVIRKDTLQANRIVNYFEANPKKNPVLPVVAFFYAFFSKLLVASQVPDKSEKGIASALKVSPYAVRDYSYALRQYPQPRIIDNITFLKEADLKLKGVDTGSTTEGQIMRELVWRLIH